MSDTVLAYPGSGPASASKHGRHRRARGPASKADRHRLWLLVFILSDMVMFSALFRDLRCPARADGGWPSGRELFDLRNVAIKPASARVELLRAGSPALRPITAPRSGFRLRWRSLSPGPWLSRY